MLISAANKNKMQLELPFEIEEFVIRELEREDIELYANWPDYPTPYEMFNTSLKNKPTSERKKRWEEYRSNNNVITLVVDHKESKTIAKFSFMEIDWEEKSVKNVGIRLHPHWCNMGNGTKLLKGITNWCFNNGIQHIQFDVLSTNQRAIKSYQNAGYCIVDDFKNENGIFYWMESKCL